MVKPEEAAKKEEGAINPVLKALQEAPAAPPPITSSITNQIHQIKESEEKKERLAIPDNLQLKAADSK